MSLTQSPSFSEGFALVIGVGQYADPSWNVETAERDAQSLYETLIDPQLSAYPRAQVELLTGPAATRDGVLQALGRLAQRAGPERVVLIAFTGHGALGEDGLYYLATADTRFVGGERIARGSGVSVRELAKALGDIQAGHLLLVLNSCFSGVAGEKLGTQGFGPERGSLIPEDERKLVLNTGEGRAVITACRADQRSYFAPDSQHSYFGQALIDALRGTGVTYAGGYVGLFELYNALYPQVRRATGPALPQEPLLTVLQAAGPFPIARYPGASEAGDRTALEDRPSRSAAPGVQFVTREELNAIGAGAMAIRTGDNSPVNIQSGLINFGSGVQAGDISIGDVAGGDIIKTSFGAPAAHTDPAPQADMLARLPWVANQLSTARNVDVVERADAVNDLRIAYTLATQGDRVRAAERLRQAIARMRAMGNSYVNSLAQKAEQALAALSA